MFIHRILATLPAAVFAFATAKAADFSSAANATNQLGVDLYHQLATPDGNLCLSPYSIQEALAMTFAGADGATRTEMARVLHYHNAAVYYRQNLERQAGRPPYNVLFQVE